jgi:hypothetical protein
MRESAQAALTYLQSDGPRNGIEVASLADRMVHVHVPAGASPKDGPSAGVAMLAAMASIASGRPVRSDVAMTGEITLRGKVLPVGGIKEKLLAAHRAGIRRVYIPRRNEADLDDLPHEIRSDLDVEPIDSADELLQGVLEPAAVEPPGGLLAEAAAGERGVRSNEEPGRRDGPEAGEPAAPGIRARRAATAAALDPQRGASPDAIDEGVSGSRRSRANRSRGSGPAG